MRWPRRRSRNHLRLHVPDIQNAVRQVRSDADFGSELFAKEHRDIEYGAGRTCIDDKRVFLSANADGTHTSLPARRLHTGSGATGTLFVEYVRRHAVEAYC
jgi:hypothetical protein